MIQLYSMLTLRATKYSKSLASLCFSGNATKQNDQDVLRQVYVVYKNQG